MSKRTENWTQINVDMSLKPLTSIAARHKVGVGGGGGSNRSAHLETICTDSQLPLLSRPVSGYVKWAVNFVQTPPFFLSCFCYFVSS